MNRKLGIIFFFLISAWAMAVSADEPVEAARRTISGVVSDENGEPLPGASVAVVGTTLGAGSNSDGKFSILLNERTSVTLRISYTGYEPQEVSITSSDFDKPVAIQLQPADNLLNEVVVTGTRIERPLKEIPVLTRVITPRDIQTLNPATFEDLLLYELPGLQISYNSMSQLPEIKYQGVDGKYMLFLIDGERVSGEGANHNVDFSRFNVDDIERIEIIRGSQSTVYGSNALGGVINIITKNADRPFTGNIGARYAGVNGQKYTASVGMKKQNFSTLTSVTYRTKDTYSIEDKKGKAVVVVDSAGHASTQTQDTYTTTIYGYKIWDVSQKLGYAFSEKLSANVKGSFYHNERDIRTGRKFQDFFVDYALSGNIKYLLSENQRLNASYIYDNYKKDKNFFDAGFTRTDYRNMRQTARLDYAGTFGTHTVSAGFEGDFEYLKHYMLKDSADKRNETYAIYLQEDWKILENLNVVAGLRGDYHKAYHLHVTPKISMMYHPIEALTLRAGYSQGFRSPSLKELYQEYDMGGSGWMMLYGNQDLKPETSNQYSLSAEVNKGGFNASVSSYHNRFKDKIAYATLGDGTSDMRYVNAEKAKTTGIEAIAQMRFDVGLKISASYAYIDDYEEQEGKNTSSVRPHSATFGATYSRKFGKVGATIALNGRWSSKLDTYTFTQNGGYRAVTYDARTLCTLNAGVQLPKGISLSLGIDNLFNYKDKASDSSLQVPQKGISAIGSVNINLADMFRW